MSTDLTPVCLPHNELIQRVQSAEVETFSMIRFQQNVKCIWFFCCLKHHYCATQRSSPRSAIVQQYAADG